ncbi:hypothetical protein N2152v2_009071 [Parachlorella kessleri]
MKAGPLQRGYPRGALWSAVLLALAVCGGLLICDFGSGSSPSVQQLRQAFVTAVVPPPPAGPPRTAGWHPTLLPLEHRRWVHDAVREPVPSIVSLPRRQLSMELAIGALLAGIEGDIVECGVALGGTSILLAKVLEKYDPEAKRLLWAADSFDGLPAPTQEDSAGGLLTGKRGEFNSSELVFQANLLRWGVLQRRVRVLKGWFNESLPGSGIQRIAFLRLDGDLYVSTMDPLEALYDRLSPGALVYVDDYFSFNGCRKAVDEFRAKRGITGPLHWQHISDTGFDRPANSSGWEAVWWMKT